MGKLGKRKGRLRATDSVDPLAARLAWRVTLAVAPQLCDTAFGRLCSDQQRENGKTAGSRSWRESRACGAFSAWISLWR